uniref:J domain-containing protein n=1 Tax=Oryza barthii TaxID=65489 RepID=A0A0D3G7X7_9ORYZ
MGNPPELYYRILNISRDTSPKEIRAAYKTLVRQWHPDKHPPSSKNEAEARFKAITDAYEAPPLERRVECTLEELCSGCKKEVKYTRDVVAKNGLVSKKEETKTIRVKPGWKKGMKVTFEGMGDERPGCLPGDAVFTISERKHKVFKRKGNDLVLKAEVPLVSALTGWSFSFRLIDGEKMSYTFRDEVISPGGEKAAARGDLRVKFDVVFPKNLTGEQRAGLASILRACP